MAKAGEGKVRKTWRNKDTEVILLQSGSPTRYEVQMISGISRFRVTRHFPTTKDLSIAEKLFCAVVEEPWGDPKLQVVKALMEEARKQRLSRKNVRKRK